MAHSTDTTSSNSKEPPAPHSQAKQGNSQNSQFLSEAPSSEPPSREPQTPLSRDQVPLIIKLLKAHKSREWEAIKSKVGPLNLLDLPVDVLRLIVKEASLLSSTQLTFVMILLTEHWVHSLTIPNIYARFDIVWPDASLTTTDSKSIDALTYGLSTLCLGSKFAQRTRWLGGTPLGNLSPSQKLSDNQYAKYTRKFSLGNGPSDWTSEYMITKETGKMLGTLVAIAVGKMINLETFVWDMPTGVLSDIFMGLASLQDHHAEGESKLEKVWIRWHDNSDTSPASTTVSSPTHPLPPPPPLSGPAPGSTMTPTGNTITPGTFPPWAQTISYSECRVEYPTFSVLSPLKSLTVLDIDELAYLDEMSVLIERSLSSLRELRVGISQKAQTLEFAQTWDGIHLEQVDHDARWPGDNHIGDKRLGGVLGVLVGRIYDIRRKSDPTGQEGASSASSAEQSRHVHFQDDDTSSGSNGGVASSSVAASDSTAHINTLVQPRGYYVSQTEPWQASASCRRTRDRLDGKLTLRTLALERVALSMQVCTKAIDWSVLTDLTILNCDGYDALWRVLRRHFQPTPTSYGSSAGTAAQYHLALKHIHTDMTSPSLVAFLKETLAPNSLEVLFLQDRRRRVPAPPAVTIDQIFKGPIKRHRSSLKKLLLDSSDRRARPLGNSWVPWKLSSDLVSYITSGRMGSLKELAAAFDYKDWHPFLQRLPNIPQLRSLHIPHMLEHLAGTFEPKELAYQLVDIITLRPEVQLCYVGIGNKCFEILEARNGDGNNTPDQHGYGATALPADNDEDDTVSDGGEETEDDDDGDDMAGTDNEDDMTEVSDDGESEADSIQESDYDEPEPRLRLREILFYDDKVAVFKARHGRL
ncbi:Uu.00g048610.m01.CDS01 [Anthostomella pinea]|uniref:Uu.00g048610.m01.CDS01 n=1 Tax=Anthostomella pinea TaxID=933095 RepID=A0AAI8YEU7_9PEZI|nr:Uu.00g048610.m01.CDS01 [Anthostomella pinea]